MLAIVLMLIAVLSAYTQRLEHPAEAPFIAATGTGPVPSTPVMRPTLHLEVRSLAMFDEESSHCS